MKVDYTEWFTESQFDDITRQAIELSEETESEEFAAGFTLGCILGAVNMAKLWKKETHQYLKGNLDDN